MLDRMGFMFNNDGKWAGVSLPSFRHGISSILGEMLDVDV